MASKKQPKRQPVETDKLITINPDDPESVRSGIRKLSKIVLPWHCDESVPPRQIRVTATGERVGTVDSWLGGYGDPHNPDVHGWGYRADPSTTTSVSEGLLEDDEEARSIVDNFLRENDMIVLGDHTKVESRTN